MAGLLLSLKRPFLFPFYLLHEKPLQKKPLWRGSPGRIQMMGVQTALESTFAPRAASLAEQAVAWDVSNDYKLIQTDVRHKQLKFNLNIYKNPGLSYKCCLWEGDRVIYSCCSHSRSAFVAPWSELTWLAWVRCSCKVTSTMLSAAVLSWSWLLCEHLCTPQLFQQRMVLLVCIQHHRAVPMLGPRRVYAACHRGFW